MHIIDYIPWPIIVLILTCSLVIVFKFFVLNKKLGIQERVGGVIMFFGGFGMIMEEIIQGTKLNIKYLVFLEYAAIPTVIGFLILFGGIIKRIDDPAKKRQVKIYYLLLCLFLSFFAILFIYLWLTGQW